jgi:hypothetical protein
VPPRRAIAIFALVVCAALPVGAHAAPPQSATRFVAATERGHQTLKAALPEIGRRAEAIDAEVTGCEHLVNGRFSKEVEVRIEVQGVAVIWAALLHPYVELSLPAWRQVVADLDAIPTRDRALQAGRAAWRRGVRLFESFAPPLERPCEALARWKEAGFTAQSAPISRRDALRYWETLEATDDERDDRYARAVRRLRQLGVRRRAANAFDGHRAFDIFSDDH